MSTRFTPKPGTPRSFASNARIGAWMLILFLLPPLILNNLFLGGLARDQSATDRQNSVIQLFRRIVNGVVESTVRFGTSVEGKPLLAYTLGEGSNVTLITAGIHGNEPSSPGVAEDLRSYLLAHPDEWRGCKVIVVPHVNPDGDAAGTRANAHGVDLNRNFPYDWARKRKGVKLSTGTGPLSEPESRGIMLLLDTYRPSKSVSIHQPLDEVVGVGTGGTTLANAMRKANGYHETGDVGYPTPGTFGAYLWHKRGIACVTLEMPRISVQQGWARNREALMNAIRYAYAQWSPPSNVH